MYLHNYEVGSLWGYRERFGLYLNIILIEELYSNYRANVCFFFFVPVKATIPFFTESHEPVWCVKVNENKQ